MEFQRSAVEYEKAIVRLEVERDQLQRQIIDLKEELMEAKLREEQTKENMMENWVKAKGKYKNLKVKFILEESKWKEEEEKFSKQCRQLGVDKRKLEIDLKAATSSSGSGDLAMKLKAAQDEVRALVNWVEEKDGMIGVLEEEKRQLEAEFCKVKVKEVEMRAMEDKSKKEISELTCRIEGLERDNMELEANFHQVNMEKSEEINRILNEKTTMEAESEKKGLELVQKIKVLERIKSEEIERILNEKRTMEVESEVKVLELVLRIDELEREKWANEAKVCQADREKSEEISMLLNEKMVVEAEKTTMEMKVLELVQKIEALERENKEIKTEICQANKDKSEDVKRILDEKMAVEAKKAIIEAEGKKKVLELVLRIQDLERVRREMEAEVCLEKKEMNEEMGRILKEKMVVEAEKTTMETENKKKTLELVRRNDALEREIEGLEAEVCEEREKTEKIWEVLNEKTPSQKNYEKRILRKEKHGLEAETGNNDGLVHILIKDCSVDNTKRMEMETKRSEEDEELSPQVHPAPKPHDQGSQSKSDYVFVAEPNKESSLAYVQVRWQDGRLSRGRASPRSQKQKIEALECSLANEATMEHGLI